MGFRPPSDPDLGEEAWLVNAAARLPALIHQLTPDEQRVVIAYFYEQRTLAELAGDLNWHPERVETVLRTALRTLRRLLPG